MLPECGSRGATSTIGHVNLPNLRENIRPTRERATLIFTKGPDHRVESLSIRKD